MLTFRSFLRFIAVILTLAVAGLTVATEATPAAHANSFTFGPSITTSTYDFSTDHGSGAVLDAQGSNFTPGGSVTVYVLDSGYYHAATRTFTASPVTCGPILCFGGGSFTQGFEFLYYPRFQTVHVIARNNATGVWSNWSNIYIA